MGGRVGKPRPLHIWSSQKWDTKIKSEGTKLGNGVWVGFGTRRLLSPHIGLPAEHKLGLPDAHNWLVDLELRKNLSERYQWVMGECSLNLFQFIIS